MSRGVIHLLWRITIPKLLRSLCLATAAALRKFVGPIRQCTASLYSISRTWVCLSQRPPALLVSKIIWNEVPLSGHTSCTSNFSETVFLGQSTVWCAQDKALIHNWKPTYQNGSPYCISKFVSYQIKKMPDSNIPCYISSNTFLINCFSQNLIKFSLLA